MGDENDEYGRQLERWAATPLPVFRVANWDGTWLLGNSAAPGAIASDGTHHLFGPTAQDVWHRRPDVRDDAITVTSSRRDDDDDEALGSHSGLGNMAIQILKDRPRGDATADEWNRHIDELFERLRAGEFPWTTATFSVDGVPTDFQVLAVEHVWFAYASLDDVNIELLGHHTPFADLQLAQVVSFQE